MSVPAEDVRKQELRKKIEYQVKCEERAHQIVERLIDNPVSEELLIDSVRYISPSHYGDITEERAISKLCGYPLCPNILTNIPKQKYFISTKTNKVYDIEKRKNYCSGNCYQVSLHMEKQISNAPLWSRKDSSIRPAELLPLDRKIGIVGDEVLVSGREEITCEVKKLEHIEKYQSALHQRQEQAKADNDNTNDSAASSGNKPEAEYAKESKSESDCDIESKSSRHSMVNATNNANQQREQLVKDSSETVQAESENTCVYDLEKALDAVSFEQDRNNKGNTVKLSEATAVKNTDSVISDVSQNCEPAIVIAKRVPDPAKELITHTHPSKQIDTHIPHGNHNSQVQMSTSVVSNQSSNDDAQVQMSTSVTSSKTSKPKSRHNETDPMKAKTDHLLQLLNKRKSLLSKMADIQPSGNIAKQSTTQGDLDQQRDGELQSRLGNSEAKTVDPGMDDSEPWDTDKAVVITNVTEKPSLLTAMKPIVSDNKDTDRDISCRLKDELVDTSKGIQTTDSICKTGDSVRKHPSKKTVTQKPKGRIISTLELICRSLEDWITVDTVECLDAGAKVEDVSWNRSEFKQQYQTLVAKVDAQERDFSDLLGEESLDDGPSQPTAPAPHFEVLKQETEEDTARVNEFIKGSFTYKVQERATAKDDGGSNLVLPTVDRYDQLLIRQRIVLDRISKVLPDLLFPLHLLIQDVYTELKDVVLTFNLTRENIVFKSSEWTLVMLILLKLIARKVPKLEASFAIPGAEKFFTILLGGVGSDMPMLDRLAGRLLQKRTKRQKSDS